MSETVESAIEQPSLAVDQAQRSLWQLEDKFKQQALHNLNGIRALFGQLGGAGDHDRIIEDHRRLIAMSEHCLDISAQLGFFGYDKATAIAARLGKRLSDHGRWNADAAQEAARELNALVHALAEAGIRDLPRAENDAPA